MASNILTQARLKELLQYDPDTGCLVWRKTNRRAGTKHYSGYRNVFVDNRCYIEHRVIWVWVFGEWPDCDIDHVNRQRDDNRLVNLRLASRAENCQNQPIRRSNKSGVTGVYYHKASQKWAAVINVGSKQRHLGTFECQEDAVSARLAAQQQHYSFVV
jgi:hypothetical protein